MKHTLILLLLMISSIIGCAQAYDSAVYYRYSTPTFDEAIDTLIARAMMDPDDTSEGGLVNHLNRWKYFMGGRVSNNVPMGASMHAPYGLALGGYMSALSTYCATSGGNWNCIGPLTNSWGRQGTYNYDPNAEFQGRINSIWTGPNPNDTNVILAGADEGGLWKTTDGGKHWRNITDGTTLPGTIGVNYIAVNPLDTNIIYLSAGMSNYQYMRSGGWSADGSGYQLGLVYSTDGGATWSQDTGFNSLVGATVVAADGVGEIAYMPGTQHLFAVYKNKIFYKKDSSTAWVDISHDSFATRHRVWALEFTHQTPIRAVVSTSALRDTSTLWLFDPTASGGSGAWTSHLDMAIPPHTVGTVTTTYYQHDGEGPVRVAITSADSAFIEFSVRPGSSSAPLKTILMNTHISAVNLNMINTSFPMKIVQMEVSQTNSNVIYGSCVNGITPSIVKSTDRGKTFPTLPSHQYHQHADGRCLKIQFDSSNSDYDVIFWGTDGGVCKKRTNNTYCSITGDGLAITEFFGFGNTEANEGVIVGAAQDNGGLSYIKNRPEPWEHDQWGDGFNAKMMHNRIDSGIVEDNAPGLSISEFSGISSSMVSIIPPSEGCGQYRPLTFNHSDTAFIGYQHIWYRKTGTSGWSLFFPGGEPRDGGTLNNIFDFYIDEHNNNNAYIAYQGAGSGKLFFSNDAKNTITTPTWYDRTTALSAVTWDRINTICVDPEHTNRIWVGLGDVNFGDITTPPDSMINRIFYSDDYGASWTDVSKGLSALPVNKIICRKGGEDELYAGTDVGVFKWNKSLNRWECFNTGMPICIVMDMEFNYCAGKLRAATYGRGIWETILPNQVPLSDSIKTTISGMVTWSTNKWLETSVTILPGATLTILNDTIHMPKNGVITVMPGGRLVVDHAMITNSCDQCFWKGIEAQGNSGLPQTTTNQGWVRIRNGSTIENAYIGVSNYNSSIGLTSTGGIVQGDGSFFINNQNAVTFKEYHNWSGSLLSPDRANFTNCTFLLDNNYKGNATGTPAFNNHVVLQGVDGISFIGCQFLNRDTVAPFKVRGEGIHATDASIMVQAYCYSGYMGCPYPVKNRFCGFANGITIEYTGAGLPLTSNIDRALFDTVTIGINNIAMNNVLMTRNHFKIGHGRGIHGYDLSSGTFSGCYQNIGILSQGSQQFRMEENTFDGAPVTVSGWYNIGTAVVSSGLFGNRVYRNTFDSLSFGVYALGDNQSTRSDPGLKILCNNFVHSTYDIAIATHDPLRPQGIGAVQGLPDVTYSGSGLDTSSGNTFSSGVTYNATNSTISRSEFYYRIASENPLESSTHLTTYPVSISPTCLPTFVSGLAHDATSHVTLSYVTFHKQKFREFNEDFQNTFSTYISLIDFGNTDSLKTVIGNSSDTSVLYSILSGGSPYISKDALKEVATTMTLPAYSMMHILFQNPDNLRDPDFLSVMEDTYTYPSSVMDAFADSATNQTNRTKMESAMSWLQGARDNHANIVLMALKTPIDTTITGVDSSWAEICTDTTSVYFLQDSNKHYVWLDSVDVWLQNIGGQWTEYERVGYHHFRGNTTEADNIFTDIGNSLPANSSEDTAKYVTYTKIWEAIKSAEADDRSIWSLDSTEIASLDTSSAALVTNNEAQLMILGITHIIPTSDYLPGGPGGPGGPGVPMPPPTAPDPCLTYVEAYKQSHNDNEEKPRVFDKDAQRFFAYPNPSSGIVTFSYDVPDAGGDMIITIKNIVGETVKQMNTGNNKGTVQWNPVNLASGIYIYSATGKKGIISNGKLVLIK